MRQTNEKIQHAYHQSYNAIRDMILSGEIPCGTKLVEERLATVLGVSRTPIRESIRRLELEGLIKNKMVINPSEKDLRDMFQVRIQLEGYSAYCAAAYLSENKLKSLGECITMGRTGNFDQIIKANQTFHEIIVHASNNLIMIDIIDRMKALIDLSRRTLVYHSRPFLIDEHEKIYHAIMSHDCESSQQLMQEHLQKDLDFCLHFLNEKINI